MRGDVDDAQLGRHQHHGDFRRAGEFGEKLGMARILVACGVQSFLAQRRRADRHRIARLDDLHRLGDAAIRALAGHGRHRAEGVVRGISLRSTHSTVPGAKVASATESTAWTVRFEPTMRPAARSRSASPTTKGRHIAVTSGRARAFMMISGPMPEASPMVIATAGRFMRRIPDCKFRGGGGRRAATSPRLRMPRLS